MSKAKDAGFAPLASVPRRYALVGFFGLTFVFSWNLWIPTALAPQGMIVFPLSPMVTGILGAFGPTLASVIMTALEAGWPGLRTLGRRLWLWRVGIQWYLFMLLWPVLLSLCVTSVASLLGQAAPDFANPPFVTLYPLPPEASEIGWWFFVPFVFLQQLTARPRHFCWRSPFQTTSKAQAVDRNSVRYNQSIRNKIPTRKAGPAITQ